MRRMKVNVTVRMRDRITIKAVFTFLFSALSFEGREDISFDMRRAVTTGLYKNSIKAEFKAAFMALKGRSSGSIILTTVSLGTFMNTGVII